MRYQESSLNTKLTMLFVCLITGCAMTCLIANQPQIPDPAQVRAEFEAKEEAERMAERQYEAAMRTLGIWYPTHTWRVDDDGSVISYETQEAEAAAQREYEDADTKARILYQLAQQDPSLWNILAATGKNSPIVASDRCMVEALPGKKRKIFVSVDVQVTVDDIIHCLQSIPGS